MNISTRCFLSVLIALGCAWGARGANLLNDTGFPAKPGVPSGWEVAGGGPNVVFVADPAVTHGAAPSVRVTAPPTMRKAWNMLRHPVAGIRPKTSYVISAWVKTEGCAPDTLAYISFNCENRQSRLASNDSQTKIVGNSDWTRIVSVVKDVPTGTQSAKFVCCLYGAGTAHFAGLQVEEGTTATDWALSAADTEAIRLAAAAKVAAAAWRAANGLDTLAPGTARIAVLDLGFKPGRNAFGYMSDPAVFLETLAPLGRTFRLSGNDVVRPGILLRESIDLLVVPTGAAWPADAADALVAYLRAGGSLLTCGGYAFDAPVYWKDGSWTANTSLPLPAATSPVPLAAAKDWHPSAPQGKVVRIVPGQGPNGNTAVEVRSDSFHLWATGGMPLRNAPLKGMSAISFFVRSPAGATRGTLELDESDGSRWQVHFPVTTNWTEQTFSAADFVNWPDSPAVGRGGEGDRVNFDEVRHLAVGASPNEAVPGAPLRFGFADFRAGVDPHAALRARRPAQINTRTAHIRDAIHPKATQINAFDPSFELRHVARVTTAPALKGALPDLAFDASWTGLAAIAQLGVNGHGYSQNRCALHPILEAYAADGTDRGPAAAFVHHHSETFAGSSWAIFGVDNADLFAADSPLTKTLLPAVAKKLLARLALNETTTSYACYRAGETARLQTRVGNFGAATVKGTVRFTITDEAGRVRATRTKPFEAPADANTSVEAEWPITADAPDYLAFTAELLDESGRVYDREPGGFVVWNEGVIAKGPKISLAGSRFAINGRPGFYMGAQTYWGQTRPTVARSPMSFYRDFRQMQGMGLRLTRLFLPWTCEEDKRISDACVQLAQKFGLVIYHTQQNVSCMVQGAALADQNAHFREIALRYKNVPGFMIDIRNEPVMQLEPSWDSAKRMRTWLATNRAAARESRPDAIVSVGWSQGWAGGKGSKDPAWCSLDLDFTDRHYYGPPERMFRDFKDLDMRALGKPLTMPECGAKCHPTFVKEDPWHMGDTDEGYDYRFRCLVSHAFGLGGTALLGWHWRDPIEGIFPCGLVHGTGVPRPTALLFSKMAKTLGRLRLADNPPDVVVRLKEAPRMANEGRGVYLEKAYAVDAALKHWGANWSKITESAIGGCSVRLVLDPDTLPTDDAAALKKIVGERLAAADCATTRRAEDPDELETYRVPGEGATGWMFWNAGDSPITTTRAGQTVTVPSRRAVYLQIADDGRVEVRETF